MAVRKLVVNFGQSNSGPYHDIASWLPDRVDLNLLISANRVSGAYAPDFAMPFNAPGYSGTRPLKGLAIRNIRYLTFYNPIVTGYTSYPGTGRVLDLASTGFLHSALTVWVEQQFVRGTHQVAAVVRKTNGRSHPVKAILTPSMAFTTDFGTSTQELLLPAHGLITNDQVTLQGADLPAGLLTATTYYVGVVDDDKVFLSLTAGGAPVTFSDDGTGTHTLHPAMPARAGSRLMFDVADAWIGPAPQAEEEFTFAILATAAETNEAEAELNLNFGVLRQSDAKLVGLQLRHVASGNVRIIDTWDPVTRTATLVNKVGLAPQTWTIAAGDELVIEPQTGQAWDRYAYFLPWSMFEAQLSATFVDKINPYMPGFDYPGDFHSPQIYGTDAQTPTAIASTGGLFLRTSWPNVSWHVGMLTRLSELFGEEVWCVSTDFGGTSASHDETRIGTETVGWYDQGQQTDWSPGRTNGCFQRWLDELDAAIAAAAALGDTLQVVCVYRNQGFADATSKSDPTYGPTAAQSGISATKWYDTNRAFRARARAELKARGLWPGQAAEIPWVQPKEQEEAGALAEIGDPALLKRVNEAVQQLADEDDFAETWEQTGLITGPDGIHFIGSELAKAEQRAMQATVRIFRRADRSGEIAICNQALQNLGESGRVISIRPSDGSAEANLCAEHFDVARDAVLEARNWGFASKRRRGFERDSEATSFQFCYVRPSDCLRLIKVLPPDALDDEIMTTRRTAASIEMPPVMVGPAPQNHIEETLGDGTVVIYTNQEDAVLVYVSRVSDSTRWSAQFRDALGAKLTAKLAGAIVKGPEGARARVEWEQVAQALISQAAELDAAQFENPPTHIPSWLAAMD